MPSPSPIKPILRQVLPHPLQTACWSPSGLMLAVGGSDGMVGVVLPEGGFVWKRDAVSWIEAVTLTVTSLAWSQDKNLLAVSFSVSLDILNSTDGKCISSYFYPENFKSLAWNRDSSSVLASNEDSYETFPAFCDDDEPFFYPNPITISAQGVILAARFDHDEKFCFITNSEKILSDYYGQNRAISYHAGGKISLASFSPSGRFTLLYRDGAPSLVIDAENPAHETLFRPMSAKPKCICVNEGGTHIACGLEDGGVLVQLSKGEEIRLQDIESDGPVVWLGFAPSGHRLLVAHASGAMNIWDCAELGKEIIQAFQPALENWLRRQSASMGYQYSGGKNSESEIWVPHLPGANDAGLLGIVQTGSRGYDNFGVALSKDGRRLYCTSDIAKVQAWDLTCNKLLWEVQLEYYGNILANLALSADETCLAVPGDRKGVYLLNAQTGECLKILHGFHSLFVSVAFSPNGQWLLAGTKGRDVNVWDITTGNTVVWHEGDNGNVTSVAYSTSGKIFAAGGISGCIHIWDANTHKELATVRSRHGIICSLTYSPIEDTLACLTGDGSVLLLTHSDKLQQIGKHPNGRALIFSSDGRCLASSSDDQGICIWDIATKAEYLHFNFPSQRYHQMAWSDNKAFLVASAFDGDFYIFDTRPKLTKTASRVSTDLSG